MVESSLPTINWLYCYCQSKQLKFTVQNWIQFCTGTTFVNWDYYVFMMSFKHILKLDLIAFMKLRMSETSLYKFDNMPEKVGRLNRWRNLE